MPRANVMLHVTRCAAFAGSTRIPVARGALAAAAIMATPVMLPAITSTGVEAQTLTSPTPAPKTNPLHPGTTKSQPTKACRTFGPGFVQVPGTEICVKIGSFVTVEGATGR
jgi:hypothetical protein